MKRRRVYLASNYSGPSFSDLPRDVMTNVLLRLSVKRIVVCKLVCKTWHGLISEPGFAKLHFDRTQAYPLIQAYSPGYHYGKRSRSRMLYLVQPEEDDFECKLDICDHSVDDSECRRCRVKFDIDAKFNLPMVIDDKHWYYYNARDVVNSCNGLLCLSSSYNNDPLIVCNPVTGEFIKLPRDKDDLHPDNIWCGFGFRPSSNQYMVVRTFYSVKTGSHKAEIHTLGTKTWRDIEYPYAHGACGLRRPTYLNGFLHQLHYHITSYRLSTFDIENECFSSIAVPPLTGYDNGASIGVVGGELSVSCLLTNNEAGVWVMKSVGTTNQWSKVFSVRLDWQQKFMGFGKCQPIKYLNDGALLMFNSCRKSFIYKHPRKQRIRYFKFRGTFEGLEVFAHIPSFVSLKDVVSGHNVEVLKSRWSTFMELKLEDEDRGKCVKGVYEVKYKKY